MIRRPPRSTRTDTLFPYTTLFRSEIAEDLGWPRSSSFKLVATLAAKGYLYEPRARGGYYPSPRWLVLAEAVSRAEPLPEAYHRLAQDLMQEIGRASCRERVCQYV